jgi:ABC-type glycerol-3-phosphate transport system permease component
MKYIVSPGFERTVSDFKGRTAAYWPQITAASVLTAVPVLVVYPFFQRYFISGLKVGSIKD